MALDLMNEAQDKKARLLAIEALGELVDSFHSMARRNPHGIAKETFRKTADLISEMRKELQEEQRGG